MTNFDLYINGNVAKNGGQAQVNVPAGYTTAYLYLKPGVYHVALGADRQRAEKRADPRPRRAGSSRAPLPDGGHRPDRQQSLKPLLIDETAEKTQIGASPSDPVTITINGVVDSTGLDYEWAASWSIGISSSGPSAWASIKPETRTSG